VAQRGYAATPISAIAKGAGVQAPSIYWAFGNKEGVFAAVLERAAERWFVEQAGLAEATDLPAFWEVFRALGPSFDDGPEFLRLLLVVSLERRAGDPAIVEAVRQVRATGSTAVADVLYRLVRLPDERARRLICEDVGRLTVMLLDGVFVARQIDPDSASSADLFDDVATTLSAVLDARIRAARAVARPPRRKPEPRSNVPKEKS